MSEPPLREHGVLAPNVKLRALGVPQALPQALPQELPQEVPRAT